MTQGQDDGAPTIPSSATPARSSPGTGEATVAPGGTKLGLRYTILNLLGRGGMGAVYKAWDSELMMHVAIKTIVLDADADAGERHDAEARFKRELLLTRQVTHRNVVRIHDLVDVEGQKYLTMSFIEGETLSAVLKRAGPLPLPQALSFARQIADGLAAAHAVGVVHRDLKPANIMVTPDGQALIMDFGIARGAASTAQTRTGTVMGTLEYMAPEQIGGQAVDHRVDIYAFGLIVYDMLVGRRRVKSAADAMGELLGRARQPPPSPRTLRADLPQAVDALVMSCLQPEMQQRCETAASLIDALQQLTPAGDLRGDAEAPTSRGRMLVRGTAAVLMFGIAAAAAWSLANRPAAPVAPRPPISVLIATFENGTGDPLFDGLIEQALGVGIEGASFISNFSRRDALRDAAQLPGGQLDARNARLVAIRQAIPVVLTGNLATAGPGYRVSVQAIQPGIEERTLFEHTTDANSREDLLPAVGRLAARVRRDLGDTEVDPNADLKEDSYLTARSLEAAKEYVKGQDQLATGNYQAAIDAYMRAVALDPDLGRAYAGAGAAAMNAGRRDEADRYLKEAVARLDRMTEREKFRTRGLYYLVIGDADKGRDELTALIKRFPSDSAGLVNLSMAHFQRREFDLARDIGRQATTLTPRAVARQNNVALFAMYAGDFAGAAVQARQVLELNPDFVRAHLTIAIAHVAAGEFEEAKARFAEVARRPAGGTLAAQGQADLAMLRGRLNEAAAVLQPASDAETSASARGRLMRMLAEVRLAQGRKEEARNVAEVALRGTTEVGTRFAAARVLLEAGVVTRALAVAKALADQLDPEAQSLGRVIQAEAALAGGQPGAALDLLNDAQRLADSWLVRFDLARAHLALGALAEADAELDACMRRRGEAAAVFLDDVPSYRLMAPVFYYQGVVRDGLKKPGATESFKTFLAFKDGGDEKSRLVADARRRLER